MKIRNNTLTTFFVALSLTVLLASCNIFEDFPPPPEPPPQTRILRVEILPNDTLAPGDTATFRCIIADSLDSRFSYSWALDGDNDPNDIITDMNEIRWTAPSQERRYGHIVSVDNGSEDSVAVSKEFHVVVKE